MPASRPLADLPERRVDDPARQRADDAGALGERDEVDRREQPALGMVPAHERLDPGDGAVLDGDLRLVVQGELALVDAAAQLARERQALGGVGVALAVVGRDARAAVLGLVHRHVGAAQERAEVVAVLAEIGDADAGAELDRHAAEVQRTGERRAQAVGQLDGGAAVPQVGDQHRELVAAQAREDVGRSQRLPQALGGVDEQRVALLVAERVVDLLEAVEVDQQQRGARARAGGRLQDPSRVGVQLRAVRQAGEMVLARLAPQPARRGGDDAEEADPEQQQAAREDQREDQLVAGDRRGDRRVGEVQLEDGVGVLTGDAQRDVGREHRRADTVVAGAVSALGDGGAGQRDADLVRLVLADLLVITGVDDRAFAVVDLDDRGAVRLEGMHEPAVELCGAPGIDGPAQVGRRECAFGAGARHDARQALLVGHRPALDPVAEHRAQDDAEQRERSEAEQAEAPEQRQMRDAPTHGRGVGAVAGALELRATTPGRAGR